MAKKKRKQQKTGRAQQTQSFEQYMLGMTLNKFKGYIDAEVNTAAQQIANQQKNLLENMYIRIRALEEIALEKFDDLTKESLAVRIANIEDEALGLEQVESVKEGDRVRIEIATKAKDQEEYQGTSKIMLDSVGTGNTLGKELETALLDMKVAEVKEIDFGQDKTMIAKLTINRISRDLKAEAAKVEAAKKAEEAKSEGDLDVDSNEG